MKTTLRQITTAERETYLVFVVETDECLGRVWRTSIMGVPKWATEIETLGLRGVSYHNSRAEAVADLIARGPRDRRTTKAPAESTMSDAEFLKSVEGLPSPDEARPTFTRREREEWLEGKWPPLCRIPDNAKAPWFVCAYNIQALANVMCSDYGADRTNWRTWQIPNGTVRHAMVPRDLHGEVPGTLFVLDPAQTSDRVGRIVEAAGGAGWTVRTLDTFRDIEARKP